ATKSEDRRHLPKPRPRINIVKFERRTAPARRAGLATGEWVRKFWRRAAHVHNPSSTLPSLISELRSEMRRSPRRSHLHELARRRIEAPHEIIDWAKRDRRWSFTLAEMMNTPS